MNRLAAATSPYLRQHAGNPVDWWPWSEEAFAEARRRDVPILLSVGYAACHWCHVMAHDSFENDDVARLLNDNFVSIKVDREERPDVDAVYMDATTALTGQGGWPMTCFMTADGAPFFAGTFFPRAHFLQLLDAITQAWRDDRDEVLAAGQRVVTALAEISMPEFGGAPIPDTADLDEAAAQLLPHFDKERGGFGAAPKFPPSMVLEFLLRQHERTGDPTSLAMAERTLDAMARGGIYDQLAGGFARYSVDNAWVVPHFEKMLYDNALLLPAYLHWYRRTDSALAGRIAHEVADFIIRDLGTPEGGFASALDADTAGVEGLTYVWTPDQLRDALGDQADAAARLFEVTSAGTFEHGASTLQLLRDPIDVAQWQDLRGLLLASRTTRPQPERDDKVVTAWNGLAIAGLAEAAMVLGEDRYLEAAIRCADLLLALHRVDGRLRRTSRDGVVGEAAGVAEDYGDLAAGLLVLHQATADPRWLTAAGELLDAALTHFADGNGGFFDTADDAEQLVRRPKDATDNATPSGSSALAGALVAYAALTGSLRHRLAADNALRIVSELGRRQPRFLGWALAAAEALVAGPLQIAVVSEHGEHGEHAEHGEHGEPGEPGEHGEHGEHAEHGGGPLTRTAWRLRPPGAVVVSGMPDAPGVPLLADRPLVGGAPAAYVCRGMVCDLPVTSAEDLTRQLTT